MKMIPGMGGMMRQLGDMSAAEDEMKRMRVMINSMTKAERENVDIINGSRRERIAKGCGRTEKDVTEFIERFNQMKQMMVGMMSMMKGGGLPNLPGMGPVKGFRQAPKNNDFMGQKPDKPKNKGQFGKKYF
jgi:signal recognition particle subunit SRP54